MKINTPSINTLAVFLFYLLLFTINSLSAATITVDGTNGLIADDGICTITEAFINANDSGQTHDDCGSGGQNENVIQLTHDITLVQAYETVQSFGSTGTPPVNSHIRLEGLGHFLSRSNQLNCEIDFNNGIDEFRLLRVAQGGILILDNMALRNGCADGINALESYGGSILNSGDLTILNSQLSHNSATDGGGLFNVSNILSIENSHINDNYATAWGGGIYNKSNLNVIRGSALVANEAVNGSALVNDFGTINHVVNTTVSGNIGDTNDGIANYFGNIQSIDYTTFSGGNATYAGLDNYGGNINLVKNSIFHDGASCYGVGNGNHNLMGGHSNGCPGNLPLGLTDQLLGALADNGCVQSSFNGSCVPTHAILPGSEALDTSDNSQTVDQRGFSADGTRDVGAFEAQLPLVIAPADITVEATGPTTNVNLGQAYVNDEDEVGLVATVDNNGPFNVGSHVVTWTATDSQGYTASATQLVTVEDTTAPELSLLGINPVQLLVGDSYIDAGATATDWVDDDAVLTANIVVNNAVNTSMAGSYQVTYDVVDTAGNAAATLIRTVNVGVTVGGVVSGLIPNHTVVLQNNGGDNLSISTNGSFSFSTALNDGNGYDVTVLTQPNGQYCDVINGQGIVNDVPVTQVEVVCETMILQLSTTHLDFGEVAIGQSAVQPMTISNHSSASITVSQISTPDTPFSITGGSCQPLPINLLPGESCDLNITFQPGNSGHFNAAFQIISNSISSPQEVILSGSTGVLSVPTLGEYALGLLILLMMVAVYLGRKTMY